MLENCKILITGGAGFIGSHIATRLAEANSVVIFDIFRTGRLENIYHLKKNPNVNILTVDIRNQKALTKHMRVGFDYIFHLAAQASVPLSIEDPIDTIEHNINGTLNILQTAKENGGGKVIFSSSAAAYGDDPRLPKLENLPTKPISPYAVTKIAGEQFCKVFCELYDLPTVALRYFNVFGPHQDPKSEYAAVVPRFIEQVLARKPPEIFGDGKQSRDLIYIDDIVEANIKAALTEKANGKVFNIACGTRTTVDELAKMIIGLSGARVIPKYLPPRAGDIKHSYADISKAKTILNWTPKTEIQDGLKLTFDFFKDQHTNISSP